MLLNAAMVLLITGLGVDAQVLHALVQKKWPLAYGVSVQVYTVLFQCLVFVALQIGAVKLSGKTVLAGADAHLAFYESLYFLGLVFIERTLTLYYSTGKAALYSKILLVQNAVYLLFLLGLHWVGGSISLADAFVMAGLQTFVQGAVVVAAFLFVIKKTRLEPIGAGALGHIIRSSLVVVTANLVQLVAYRLDYWLLRYFRSDFEVGIYVQASKVAGLLWVLPNIIAMLLIPRFPHLDTKSVYAVFRWANLFNIVFAGGIAVSAWFLYRYWLVDGYAPGYPALLLMLPGYVCWAFVIYLGAYFSWQGQFAVNLRGSVLCLLLILVADLLLIPAKGYTGAAIANTLAYSIVLLFMARIFLKRQGGRCSFLLFPKATDGQVFKKMFR